MRFCGRVTLLYFTTAFLNVKRRDEMGWDGIGHAATVDFDFIDFDLINGVVRLTHMHHHTEINDWAWAFASVIFKFKMEKGIGESFHDPNTSGAWKAR